MAQPSALAPPPTGSSQLRVSAQGNPTATWEPGGSCPPKPSENPLLQQASPTLSVSAPYLLSVPRCTTWIRLLCPSLLFRILPDQVRAEAPSTISRQSTHGCGVINITIWGQSARISSALS